VSCIRERHVLVLAGRRVVTGMVLPDLAITGRAGGALCAPGWICCCKEPGGHQVPWSNGQLIH
jgi:hypothetical protein